MHLLTFLISHTHTPAPRLSILSRSSQSPHHLHTAAGIPVGAQVSDFRPPVSPPCRLSLNKVNRQHVLLAPVSIKPRNRQGFRALWGEGASGLTPSSRPHGGQAPTFQEVK